MSLRPHLLSFDGIVPEQASIVFETSGSCGGDSGHGGYATLTITKDHQNLHVRCLDDGGVAIDADDIGTVEISTFGDWELEGMALGIAEIGRKLIKNKGDIQNVAINWAGCNPFSGMGASQEDIGQIAYRVFELIEPALKQAIAQAIDEHLK